MATDLVPRAVLSPPESARRRVSFIVGAASGAMALAGIWLRFADGLEYRLVLAVTSAIFAWLTMEIALSAENASIAAGRAWGMSIVLGALSTLIPAIMMGMRDRAELTLIFVPFGAILGAFVGFAYGIVLAIVAAATFNRVASKTHDGADRAVRIASVWAIVPMAFIALVVFGNDAQVQLSEWSNDRDRAAHDLGLPLGMLALGIVAHVAVGSFFFATRSLVRRRKWLEHVSSGIDPLWNVREIKAYEELPGLPRLRHTGMVLERKNEHSIYRATSVGQPVALL